jgi:hypothetical protein
MARSKAWQRWAVGSRAGAQAIRVEGHLVVEQVVADAIGLVSGVQSSRHVTHAAGLGALLDAADGRDVAGGVQADQEQGIA